jgi:N4-gp56 family major capsid protein
MQFDRAATYAKSTAYPKLPPIKISKIGSQTIYRYMGLMHDHVAFDLRVNDPVYQQVAREAGKRGDENWLVQGAMMDWNGVSLHSHDNCPIFTTWGSGSTINGAESYLFGRQAFIVGIGGYRMEGKNGYLKMVEKKFDYENQFGMAIGIIKGEAKSQYNSLDFSEVAIRSARTSI